MYRANASGEPFWRRHWNAVSPARRISFAPAARPAREPRPRRGRAEPLCGGGGRREEQRLLESGYNSNQLVPLLLLLFRIWSGCPEMGKFRNAPLQGLLTIARLWALSFGGMGSAMRQMFGDSFLSLNSRRFNERLQFRNIMPCVREPCDLQAASELKMLYQGSKDSIFQSVTGDAFSSRHLRTSDTATRQLIVRRSVSYFHRLTNASVRVCLGFCARDGLFAPLSRHWWN
jgi:hypothetical protein